MRFFIIFLSILLAACGPVSVPVDNLYQISDYAYVKTKKPNLSLIISAPTAVAGYQTSDMLYVDKPYEIASFVHNSWQRPPNVMLYSLLLQSLQHNFGIVTTVLSSDVANYRLDTEIIKLQQNFLDEQSHIDFVVRVTVVANTDEKVIFTKTFSYSEKSDKTPVGGVIATNAVVKKFTEELSEVLMKL
jgi:cholesterol transport system auxiliary component